MQILVLTRYQRLGSSSRVRFYQYYPYLKSHGVEIVNAPFFDDEYVRNLYESQAASLKVAVKAYTSRLSILIQKKDFNLIWVEKEFLPWFPASLEALFRARQVPYVVDYDDAVFHRYDLHSSKLIRLLLGKKIDRVMQNAALVIAGNEYIAQKALRSGAHRVQILPSVVDVSQYTVKRHQPGSTFAVGWIGSPVTAPYLGMIHDALRELNRESVLQLVLVGARNQPFSDVATEMMPWNEEIELTASQKFDVGVMPLPDGPFERGKCGYKLVQYMAGGLPVVASPVGANLQIVEHEINGFLSASTEDWINNLRSLRDDPQKRNKMGKAGRQKAEQSYNLHVTAPKLLELLRGAARS